MFFLAEPVPPRYRQELLKKSKNAKAGPVPHRAHLLHRAAVTAACVGLVRFIYVGAAIFICDRRIGVSVVRHG